MHASQPYILVVDDSVDTADSLSMLLGLLGYDAEPCYCGAAAIEAARARPPDVILLDIAMPGMNGFEVARYLRDLPAYRAISLVAITGYGGLSLQAREAGIDHYLVKPIDLNILLILLGRLIVRTEPSRSKTKPDGRRRSVISS